MKKTSYTFKNISAFHRQFGLPEPENPLFSILRSAPKEPEANSNEQPLDNAIMEITCEYYAISLKNIISGEIVYGRTKYDCSKGSLLFTAPSQTLSFKEVVVSSDSYHIAFHKDYLNGSSLFEAIKKYSFFNYHVNEALHLSPKEEELIKTIFKNIEAEYQNNQDEFSKKIILSHLETLMQYANRFYKRQFLNRKEINKALFTRFKSILDNYYGEGKLMTLGIPSVEWLASQLGVSHRYMSDTIKTETGKTAIDQINLYLIEQAKNLLLAPNVSISETAYKLGFEYPQYFSRIFKKKVGISPKKYIENAQLN
ncbi:helix-turn-helix domain-containing protein [Aureispira anguillae]|uniref:Helix-turn-helix transcriptional regulator n=1 Tax=Aureispira anguillae TaxID=2864201 RepID=A0A916DTJ4_9BACT|nr:AraC family transcriptional regulator [Aureispira anguillae]BDS11531.1 helix-turn-helix transcriptional regulator [Aureispira anguillae]